MRQVYLDYNATTPLLDNVRQAMDSYWCSFYGNPSSLHQLGQKARHAIDESREILAKLIHASPNNIIFTSGGTEANNLAIKGIFQHQDNFKGHLIVSAIEHSSVYNTALELEKKGVSLTTVPVNAKGIVDLEFLKNSITPHTKLISIMHANNETGSIQPVNEISDIAKSHKVLFHVDAVQSFGKINLNVDQIGCGLMSLSAHKIYGPKGVGLLYVKDKVSLAALISGGQQEKNIRPGTESPALIVGFAQAAQQTLEWMEEDSKKLYELKKELWSGIQKIYPQAILNGEFDTTLSNTLNITFPSIDGMALLMALDLGGIFVSNGSACSSGAAKPSHVIEAMHNNSSLAASTIRFSLGHFTTLEDIEGTLKVLENVFSSSKIQIQKRDF